MAASFSDLVIIPFMLALAGLVKGSLGFGFPLVAVSLLTTVINVDTALGLIPLPTLAANVWLAVQGGRFAWGLQRFWPVIAAMGVGIYIGSSLLVHIEEHLVFLVLGATVVVFSLMSQFTIRFQLPSAAERWAGAAAGLIGGLMGGLSTVYGPPVAVYLVSLRLAKEEFIAAIGLIWTCAGISLIIAFSAHSILNMGNSVWSFVAIVPSAAGMIAGQSIRARMKPQIFRRVVLVGLLVVGANLLRRGLLN